MAASIEARFKHVDRAWGCSSYSKMLEGAGSKEGNRVEGEDAGEAGTVMWKALDTKSLAAVSSAVETPLEEFQWEHNEI